MITVPCIQSRQVYLQYRGLYRHDTISHSLRRNTKNSYQIYDFQRFAIRYKALEVLYIGENIATNHANDSKATLSVAEIVTDWDEVNYSPILNVQTERVQRRDPSLIIQAL